MSEHVRLWIGGAWVDAEDGATFEATSPSTGEVIGTVAEGDRADAQRAIDAAQRAAPAWAALSAFDRAAAMRRVAAAIDARRDDLAHTLALDQGKPLRGRGARRGRGADRVLRDGGGRRDTCRWPARRRRSTRTSACCCSGSRAASSRSSARGTGRTRCRARSSRRRSRTGTRWCGRPAPTTSVCAAHLAECLEAADLPPGVVNMVTGPGSRGRRRDRRQPRDPGRRFHRLDRHRPHGRGPRGRQGAPARDGRQRSARDHGRRRPRQGGRRHAGRVLPERRPVDARRASGSWCTRTCARTTWRGCRRRSTSGSTSGSPFDDATTMGPVNNEPTAAKTERHVTEAVERGARVVAGGARAPEHGSALFFSATSSTASPTRWRSRARRRSARSRR